MNLLHLAKALSLMGQCRQITRILLVSLLRVTFPPRTCYIALGPLFFFSMAVDLSEITSCKIYLKQERLVHSFLQIDLMNQNVSTKDVWYWCFQLSSLSQPKRWRKFKFGAA